MDSRPETRRQELLCHGWLGRVLCAGPRVRNSHDVTNLVSNVMRQTPDMEIALFICAIRFQSGSWWKQRSLRLDLAAIELWADGVSCRNAVAARSFSVIVVDQQRLNDCEIQRHKWPTLETPVANVLERRQKQ